MVPGQFVSICVPELALYQWHPYTLTNAPEEDCLSVHVRVCGDWTSDLAECLGCRWDSQGRFIAEEAVVGFAAR